MKSDHKRTPRTDAVLNTFDGNQSRLAAKLATHAEELETEIQDITRWKKEASLMLSQWEEVWVAAGSPGLIGDSKAAAVKKMFESPAAAEGMIIVPRQFLTHLRDMANDAMEPHVPFSVGGERAMLDAAYEARGNVLKEIFYDLQPFCETP